MAVVPKIEVSNRVLREFSSERDGSLLRVTFADEDLRPLYAHRSGDLRGVTERIQKLAVQGLHLAGRVFVLMAFSSSQVREGSCWFIDRELLHGGTVMSVIHRRFGNFDNIK